MFAARGIVVSLAVFVIVYTALSLAVACGWRWVWVRALRLPIRRASGMLLALRLLPFVIAALITAVLTVPSFLLLEPRTIDEPVGRVSLLLGACAVILGLTGILNAGTALLKASRAIAEWARGAHPADISISVPVLTIKPASPAMIATGILRPRILLSDAAKLQLTSAELKATLNHELVHIRRADNLKKLLMRLVAFPGMRGLEAAWEETTEMAADEAAVATTHDALDLAAALIKLSRGLVESSASDLTAAFVHGPASAVRARVERLLSWSEKQSVATGKRVRWYELNCSLMAIFVVTAVFVLTYSRLLAQVHAATEWLIQ
jgi:beta-lactamase regulating signal transducer with metallopeptidase domain